MEPETMNNFDKPSVLVIEDEAPIRRFLKLTLSDHGYSFHEALNAREGLSKIASEQPSLVILDLGLPDMDGIELTREIREWSKVPIIVLSAREQEKDKVLALDAGADDYLTKPFGVQELLARARVAIRHAAKSPPQADSIVTFGQVKIDFGKRLVTFNDTELHLTPNEFKLLAALVRHAGRVITHTQLLREIWGSEYTDETHYLRVYMAQLRRKLETDPAQSRHLITVPGVGYKLKLD
jgi:two-component system, OmpR family, KDP operon response regulator KdpE